MGEKRSAHKNATLTGWVHLDHQKLVSKISDFPYPSDVSGGS